MNRGEALYLVPYLISLALSVGIFVFSWQRRHRVEGTGAYLWYLGGQTLAIFGFIAEMISPNIDSKILWDAFQWLTDLMVLLAFPVFVVKYIGAKIRNPWLALAISAIVPSLFLALLLTDSLHHLIYANPRLLPEVPFPELTYDFTWAIDGFAFYSWIVLFTGAGLLFWRSVQSHRLYRSQTAIIAIGILIPVIGALLTAIGLKIAPQRDAAPFTMAVGNLAIAWGLFRYHLFDITPIARDIVVENMDDLVVVLDAKERIVDINQSALKALGLTGKTIIGQPANRIFASWPVLLSEFSDSQNAHAASVALQEEESITHYEISSTLLYNKQGIHIGRVFVARDITERIILQKGLEKLNNELEERVQERTEALRESEAIFASFMEYSPIYIFFKDREIRSLRLSKNYEQMFGIPISQLLGKTMDELFPSELAKSMVKDDLRILNNGQRIDVIEEFGGRVYETTKFPIWKDGKPEMLAGFTVDITERQRAEEALKESEKRFRALIENSTDAILMVDRTWNLLYVSPSHERITGYRPEERLGRKLFEVIHPNDSKIVLQLLVGILEVPGQVNFPPIRGRYADGSWHWIEAVAHNLLDEPSVQAVVINFRDITERKQAEEALRQSEEHLSSFMDSASDSFYLLDSDLRFVEINQKGLEIIGKKKEDVIGKSITEIVPDVIESGRYERHKEVLQTGKPFVVENFIPHPIFGDMHFILKSFKVGNGLGVIATDITERKRAERALRESEGIYRQAIEVAGAVPYRQTYTYTPDHFFINYDFIGKGIKQLTGYSADEFRMEIWDSLVQESYLVGELAQYTKKEAAQRVRTGASQIWQCEHRILARDGKTHWVYEAAVELRDMDGISHGSIGLYQDITERKQAEGNLRKLSRAVEQSKASIVITDVEGAIEYVNPYFSELTGYTFEEVIGKNPRILKSGQINDSLYKELWKTITSGKEWKGEFCNKKKNGELYWESVSISPIMDSSGVITHFVAVKTDITEDKQIEIALKKSEEKHRLLFESANDCIFLMRKDCIIDCNSRAFEMFGCQREQLIGKTPMDFSPATQPDGQNSREKAFDKIDAVLKGGPQFFEWKHCRLDKTLFDAEISLNLLTLGDEILIQAIVRDITERKQAEIKLFEAYNTTLEGWANALDLREHETAGHSRRVVEGTVRLAEHMGITGEQLVHMRRGAILHDIGKIGIPDQILLKPRALNTEEWEIMRRHPQHAFELLKKIPFLNPAIDIPYRHHERWDGTGYPDGLKGEEIPLTARIFAVVDVWDALLSDRPYRKAWAKEKAIEYIREQSGKHFDPQIVETFLSTIAK